MKKTQLKDFKTFEEKFAYITGQRTLIRNLADLVKEKATRHIKENKKVTGEEVFQLIIKENARVDMRLQTIAKDVKEGKI